MSEYAKEKKFPDFFNWVFLRCSFHLRVVIITESLDNQKGYNFKKKSSYIIKFS